MLVVIAVGAWWVIGVAHAWRGGVHVGSNAVIVVAVLIVAVVAADSYGALQLWRVRNAGEVIFTGNPLNETAPPPTAMPSAPPPSWTPDPLATPTPRPPDYVDPSDDPVEPDPTIVPGPTPGFDITKIDNQNDGLLNVLLVGLDWQPGRTSKRTDTMLVVSANSATGEVLMFSFPRDSARFPLYTGGTYNGKLNTFAGYANRNPDCLSRGRHEARCHTRSASCSACRSTTTPASTCPVSSRSSIWSAA